MHTHMLVTLCPHSSLGEMPWLGKQEVLTCSTMTWERLFLRFAMKPTCTHPWRGNEKLNVALPGVAEVCRRLHNQVHGHGLGTYPTFSLLLQNVLQISGLALARCR